MSKNTSEAQEIVSNDIENELIKLTTSAHASKAAENSSIHSSMAGKGGPPMHTSIKSEPVAGAGGTSVKSGDTSGAPGSRLPGNGSTIEQNGFKPSEKVHSSSANPG
jgi:hypothetical protein